MKYTQKQVIDAIKKSRGIVTSAAKRLNCERQTVYNYIKKYPNVKKAFDNSSEEIIDFVEGKLLENVNKNDTTAIIFFLKTKGKNRGYVEKQEIDHTSDGNPITEIKITVNK